MTYAYHSLTVSVAYVEKNTPPE